METNQIIAMSAPVTISAGDGEGEQKGPAKFSVVAYTGGLMNIRGFDRPIVVDLAGMQFGNSLVANLDHEVSKRTGHVTEKSKADGKLTLGGIFSAATPYRDEVVNSAQAGFVWQASIEATPLKLVDLDAGKTATVNGQVITGPAIIARKSILKGFAFVSHGADDSTSVAIAAIAANHKEKRMKADVAAWVKKMLPSLDVDNLSADEVASLEANYAGQNRSVITSANPLDVLDEKEREHTRRDAITKMAIKACDNRPYDIPAIKRLASEAIESGWTVEKYLAAMLDNSVAPSYANASSSQNNGTPGIDNNVLQAAICMAGRLQGHEQMFDDRTLQAAHDNFRNGIGLKQLFILGAEANGWTGRSGGEVTLEIQRAAFGLNGPRQIHATGMSTVSLPNVFSNVANKFLHEGWMSVDQTPLRIAAIRSVRNFQEITTVSLTGGLKFEQVGPDGQLKSAELGELTYGNKADTYGILYNMPRTDIINDDLSALTSVPKRLGRGGMLTLNDLFWAEFLNNSSFFSSGNANVSTVEGRLNIDGLQQAEAIYMAQTDPDGNPLGSLPQILLVPFALKATADTLMTSEKVKGSTDGADGNIYRNRFRVESSSYMSNANFTGYSAAAWYLLADPNDLPVMEICALYGRVEPTVESASASFDVLGVQMRGYSDVGVRKQEYRGGVRADGSAP